jgi:hypothetical protein
MWIVDNLNPLSEFLISDALFELDMSIDIWAFGMKKGHLKDLFYCLFCLFNLV